VDIYLQPPLQGEEHYYVSIGTRSLLPYRNMACGFGLDSSGSRHINKLSGFIK
jgi:hypothetical protein